MFTGKTSGKAFSAAILSLLFAAQTSFAAAPIVTDGNTATTLSTSGNVTHVTTATVQGGTAFNSFKYFDVNAGKTVNLHLPGGTQNLINLVNSRKTKIDGVLNGFQNGQIGGNVFFLNPYGIAIGSSGVVNVGSFTAITPDKNFMKEFFTAPGNPSASATAQVLAGTVPLNKFAAIVINGRINAERDVTLIAGDVTHAGQINAGAATQSSIAGFGDFVNIDGVEVGADLVVDNGTVKIVAVDDVKITGQINVDGQEGLAGGSVAIDAGDVITVNKDAVISAKGVGNNSDGGEIIILAQDDAVLDDNAVIDASAGLIGNGGFIEFSAKDEVDVKGGSLLAAASNGLPGTILLDPAILNLDADVFTLGANMLFEADKQININGVTISSRQIAGTDHVNDASTGDSGELEFTAPKIYFNPGSQILAHATDGYVGGSIVATAEYDGADATDPIELKIHARGSLLMANSVYFDTKGTIEKTALDGDSIVTNALAEIKVGSGTSIFADEEVVIAAAIYGMIDVQSTEMPGQVSLEQNVVARALVEDGATIYGKNFVSVLSDAANNISADLSNATSIPYEDTTGVFSTATLESIASIDKGASVMTDKYLEVVSYATSKNEISLLHQKPDAETPSAAMAVSTLNTTSKATISADLTVPKLLVESIIAVESIVTAKTEFPLTPLAVGLEVLGAADLPYTMTAAAIQNQNNAKAGFIEDAIINVDDLEISVISLDSSEPIVDPGASGENTQIKGIVDGNYLNVTELCFKENADVTVNGAYELFIGNIAPESIDGLSEVSKQEVSSEVGSNPMLTKLWRLQQNKTSQAESSYIYFETSETTEDADSTSDMDSDSGSMMDSGGDSGDGYSYEYSSESSYDTSSSSSADSASSSSSSSTSEDTSTSESSSDSDSTFEYESESSSSSSSSSTP